MADHRPARRADHARAGLRAALRRAATPTSSTRRSRASCPTRATSSRGDAQPTALVQRRARRAVRRARRRGRATRWPAPQLRSTVTVRGRGRPSVDLTGLPADPAPVLSEHLRPDRLDARASCGIRTVRDPRRRRAGATRRHPAASRPIDDWASFDPDAVPVDAVGHYLDARRPAHGHRRRAGARARPGTGAYGLTSAAVSADARTGELSFLVGVRADRAGATLLRRALRRRARAGAARRDAHARRRSPPPAPRCGWCATARTSSACRPVRRPQAVNAPTLPGLGRAEVLRALARRRPRGARGGRARAAAASTSAPSSAREDGSVALRDLRDDRPVAVPGRRRRLAGQRERCWCWPATRRTTGSCRTWSASTAGG